MGFGLKRETFSGIFISAEGEKMDILSKSSRRVSKEKGHLSPAQVHSPSLLLLSSSAAAVCGGEDISLCFL